MQCWAGGMPTHPLGLSIPGRDSPGSGDTPDTEQWGGGTRKSVTHRRTHHPWWPRRTRVTLERKKHGLGVSWVKGFQGSQVLGMPWSLTRSPGLPSLPSSPSKPAGPCGDKVRVSHGGLHRGALGVPEGPPLASPGHGNTPLGNESSQVTRRTMVLSRPLWSPRLAWGGVLPGCLGVREVQGALASLWGHACPRCPARATGGYGSSWG